MTPTEIKAALLEGHTRFAVKASGRVYVLDPAQADVIDDGEKDGVLLHGFPEKPHPRKRGRRWSWLAPKSLERV